MRIVVDFQAAQTGSRYRGIGHYSIELLKSLLRTNTDHEFFLVLNGNFPDSIEPIRADFLGLLPQENIRVWTTPGPIENFELEPGNLREAGEAIREFFLRSLNPDLILITSVFEGQSDGALVSIKKFVTDVPVAAIFYDLTPLYMPDEQFRNNPVVRRWYRYRIGQLRRCDLLLAISESSRLEAIDKLGLNPANVVNIFGGRNDNFTVREYDENKKADWLRGFGITKPYILYSGGIETNKNLKTLIESLALLPNNLQRSYQVVCVGKRNPGEDEQIREFAHSDATREMIRFTDFVSQDELVDLYNCCDLFVFPSLREGFGLPPLEAMSCGAPTIVADRTSLPEVVANSDALFDPSSSESIAGKITQVLTNGKLKQELVRKGLERARELTWERSGTRAHEAIASRFESKRQVGQARRAVVSHTSVFQPNQKRILAQKLDHNGDFLLAVPAFAKLRARFPDARIDSLVGSWNRQAAEATGLFDHIHTLDYFKAKSSLGASLDSNELSNLLEGLPYYDYAVDFRRQSEGRFLLLELGASQYFGYKTPDGKLDELLTNPLPINPDTGGERGYFDEVHISEQMLRIVDALPFNANDYIRLPDMGQKLPVAQGTVAIFPRVGNDSRQWDSEYFGRLIDSLAAQSGVKQINLYVGAIDDLDVIPYKEHSKIRVHAGLTFQSLFSSLSANQVCVGNNSFGVHLASFVGCRTIGIYSGHELSSQWGPPFGESVTVSVDAACAPCHLPDRPSCPFDLFCLNDISVGTVQALVSDAIRGEELREVNSPVRLNNPANVIKPLIAALNRNKVLGAASGSLTSDQRIALAAAIAVNFPDRPTAEPRIYVDVTGLLPHSSGRPKTNASMTRARAVLEEFARSSERAVRVQAIAAGPHDHEFYEVEIDDLERSLYGGNRADRVVFPVAGDVYVGMDIYAGRNPALWNLLVSWRQAGVIVAFEAPDCRTLTSESWARTDDKEGGRLESYLFYLGHFDILVAPAKNHDRLRQLIEEHGPPRTRPIDLREQLSSLGRRKALVPGLPDRKRGGHGTNDKTAKRNDRLVQSEEIAND